MFRELVVTVEIRFTNIIMWFTSTNLPIIKFFKIFNALSILIFKKSNSSKSLLVIFKFIFKIRTTNMFTSYHITKSMFKSLSNSFVSTLISTDKFNISFLNLNDFFSDTFKFLFRVVLDELLESMKNLLFIFIEFFNSSSFKLFFFQFLNLFKFRSGSKRISFIFT